MQANEHGETRAHTQEGAMDTCIALRTMLVKDGVAYLQAGGGIVWDSVPEEEWQETMNKLAANIRCIGSAEQRYAALDDHGKAKSNGSSTQAMEKSTGMNGKPHIDLAAG